MIADIRSGRIRAVLTWHTDRLHRSPKELEEFIDLGAPTFTVKAGLLDLATPSGRMVARQLGAVARYEVEQKAARQKSKNAQVARSGRMAEGGPVPYGYRKNRRTLHPERARVVRAAYRSILDGMPLGAALRDLNARGIRAPRGGRWTYSNLRSVLLRPLNAGLVLYDGAIMHDVVGKWEPLVSEEDYFAMRALLSDPTRRTTSGNTRRHLLAGIAECGNCGKPLKSGAVGSRSGKVARLYRCGNPECAKRVNVARDPLDAYVIGRLLEERGDLPVVRTRPQADLGKDLARVEHAIRGVVSRLAERNADDEPLLARLAELRAEREALLSAPQRPSWSLRTVAEEWESTENLEARRTTLLGHLDRLAIASRGKTSHRFDPERVTLTWQDFDGVEVPGSDHRLMRRIDNADLPTTGMIGELIVTQSDGTVVALSEPSRR